MLRSAWFLALSLIVTPAAAHEYYLMPQTFAAPGGEDVAVRHRLGQLFNGNEMPFIGRWNVRSEVWKDGAKVADVSGTDGDRPALKITPEGDGLYAVVHQSNHSTYAPKSWEKFAAYLEKEGLDHIITAQDARGLDKANPTEAYSRFAKTLFAVGDRDGEDTATGLTIEFVALENPATYDMAKPLPVQLLFDGKPLANRAVKVFVGIDTEHRGYMNTDAEGVVQIPPAGKGPYLLNAIEMVEPRSDDPAAQKAQWESFWASLTFERGL